MAGRPEPGIIVAWRHEPGVGGAWWLELEQGVGGTGRWDDHGGRLVNSLTSFWSCTGSA